MNKETVKEIMYILIAIVLGIIVVKVAIWLLPIILIAICSYYIYKSIKKNRNDQNNQNDQNKNKKIKIIDEPKDTK